MLCHHWLNKALFTAPLKIVFTEIFAENINVLKWIWGIKLLKECSKHIDRLYKMHKTQLFWGHRSHASRAAPHHGTEEYCWVPLCANALFPFELQPILCSSPSTRTLESKQENRGEFPIVKSTLHDCLLIISRPALCVWETAEEREPGKRGEGGRETFPKASKVLEARREGRSLDGGLRWSVTGCSQRGNGCV